MLSFRANLMMSSAFLVSVAIPSFAMAQVASDPTRASDVLMPTASKSNAAYETVSTDVAETTSVQSNALDDVVVTANRSGAERLQNVPLPISVVNPDQLAKSGQGNLSDLAKFTPSLSITETAPGQNKFNARGLSTGPFQTSDTSDRTLVAVYLDDTPISVQGQTPDLKVYDLERVEILRGPQGTLYGAGSMAGTIRFVTAKPKLDSVFGSFEVDGATTQHGSESYNVRGMINVPIVSDTLAIRTNFYVGNDGGFIDNIGLRNRNDANSNRTAQGRAVLRWVPTDKLTFDLGFTYERSRSRGLNYGYTALPDYTLSTNGPEGTRDLLKLYQAGASYDVGFGTVVATGSYTDRHVGFNDSQDAKTAYFFQDYGSGLPIGTGSYPLFSRPRNGYSQAIANQLPPLLNTINNYIKDYMGEVRLVSSNTGRLKWTVGAFYESQRRRLFQEFPVPGFDTLSYENYFFGPFKTPTGKYDSRLVDGASQSNDIFSGIQNIDEHQVALYGEATWHATSKLDLTGGLRYFNFKEDYYLFEAGVYGVINHVPQTQNASLKSHGFNPRANASYHVNDDLMLYGEVAKGFRYGGTNQPVPLGTTGVGGQCQSNLASYGYSSAPPTFGPDKLWNYTVGEKAKLFGGRLVINGDAYLIKWQDVQTRLSLPCTFFFTANKGKILSKGLELETTFKLSPSITLSSSASYSDAHADGNIPTVGAFDGDKTPYYPTWTATAGLFYDHRVGPGDLHFQASYQYQSSQTTNFNSSATAFDSSGNLVKTGPNPLYAVVPATHNVSSSLNYEIGRYEFGIFGNNLANGVKVTSILRATYFAVYQAGDRVSYARPRTVGVRAKVKF